MCVCKLEHLLANVALFSDPFLSHVLDSRIWCLIETEPATSGGRQIPALRLQSRLQEEAQARSSEAAELLLEVGSGVGRVVFAFTGIQLLAYPLLFPVELLYLLVSSLMRGCCGCLVVV